MNTLSIKMRIRAGALGGLVLLSIALACNDAAQTNRRLVRRTVAHIESATSREDRSRCDANRPGRTQSEYDTNGDGIPDVRRVYQLSGEDRDRHSTLICREVDLNHDGTKDMFRFYNEEGRTMREEEDRNFDGRIDLISYFDRGEVVRREQDTNADGQVDMRVFYRNRQPYRAERELHSDNQPLFRADYWEYYDPQGRVTRIGWDYNQDERADQWDRIDRITPAAPQGNDPDGGPGEVGQSADAAVPSRG